MKKNPLRSQTFLVALLTASLLVGTVPAHATPHEENLVTKCGGMLVGLGLILGMVAGSSAQVDNSIGSFSFPWESKASIQARNAKNRESTYWLAGGAIVSLAAGAAVLAVGLNQGDGSAPPADAVTVIRFLGLPQGTELRIDGASQLVLDGTATVKRGELQKGRGYHLLMEFAFPITDGKNDRYQVDVQFTGGETLEIPFQDLMKAAVRIK